MQSGVEGDQGEVEPCSPGHRWQWAKPKHWVGEEGRLGDKQFRKSGGLPGSLWDWGGGCLWVTSSAARWCCAPTARCGRTRFESRLMRPVRPGVSGVCRHPEKVSGGLVQVRWAVQGTSGAGVLKAKKWQISGSESQEGSQGAWMEPQKQPQKLTLRLGSRVCIGRNLVKRGLGGGRENRE